MSFSYRRLSREEADQPRGYPLLSPGIYQFQVSKATYKMSAKGNAMIELMLTVWDQDHKQFTVFDYLVNSEQMDWKIRHFCDSVKLDKQYEDDNFNERLCPGREGLVDIGTQDAKPNPNGGMYAAKNIVLDYVMNFGGATKSSLEVSPPKVEFVDSDLPF